MGNCIVCSKYIEGDYGKYCSNSCESHDRVNKAVQEKKHQENIDALNKQNKHIEEQNYRIEESNRKIDEQNALLEEQNIREQAKLDEKEFYSRECPNCTQKTNRGKKCCEYCDFEFTDFDHELKTLKEEKLIAEKLSVTLLQAKNYYHKKFKEKANSTGYSIEKCIDIHLKDKREKEKQEQELIKRKETIRSFSRKFKVTFGILYRLLIISSLVLFIYNFFEPEINHFSEIYSFLESHLFKILGFLVIAGISTGITGEFIDDYENSRLSNIVIGIIGSGLGILIYLLKWGADQDNIIILFACTIICSIILFFCYKILVKYWQISSFIILGIIYLLNKEQIDFQIINIYDKILILTTVLATGFTLSSIEYYLGYRFKIKYINLFIKILIGIAGALLGHLFLSESMDLSSEFSQALLASYIGSCIILTLDKLMLKLGSKY